MVDGHPKLPLKAPAAGPPAPPPQPMKYVLSDSLRPTPSALKLIFSAFGASRRCRWRATAASPLCAHETRAARLRAAQCKQLVNYKHNIYSMYSYIYKYFRNSVLST